MPWAAAAAVVAGVGGAVIASDAAKSAANKQAGAADRAAQLQKDQFDQTQRNEQPYMDAGGNALLALQKGLGLIGTTTTSGGQPVTDADILRTIQQSYASSAPNDIAGGATPGNPINGHRYEFNQFYDPNTNQITDKQAARAYYDALQGSNGITTTTTPGSGVGDLNKPFTIDDFHRSPGYQFQMQEGENAVLNNASKAGGVHSGNVLKALTNYGQGVANQDWWNAYNAYVQNQQMRFGQLQTVAGSGQNAAANLGALGANAAGNIGSDLIGSANARAAGTVGSAAAIGSGLGQLGGIGSNFLLNYGSQNTRINNQASYDVNNSSSPYYSLF